MNTEIKMVNIKKNRNFETKVYYNSLNFAHL